MTAHIQTRGAAGGASRLRRPRALAALVAGLVFAGGALPASAGDDEVLPTASPVDQRYDFGSASSPVEEGYQRVAHTTLYSPELGFGLSRQVAARDRGAPDALRRDFTVGSATFSADVPEGIYWVTVLSGDTIAANYTELTVEGQDEGLMEAPAGSFAQWSGAVQVSDGRLDVDVARDGRLNALTISSQLPPVGLSAAVTVDYPGVSVALAWEERDGAVAYRVYRAQGAGEPVLVGETSATTVVDGDQALRLGEEYSYTVTQVDAQGRESSPSDALVVVAADADVPPPAAPVGLRIEAEDDAGTSQLQWEVTEGALAYDVYRTDFEGRPYQLVERTESTVSDLDVGPGTECCFRWYYRVHAVGSGGVSQPSESVEISEMVEAQVVADIDTSAAGGGARPLFGDVTGDGRLDIVMMQPHHINATASQPGPMVAALTAYSLEGEMLWQVGEVDPEGRNNTQDIPAQIKDVDGDGTNEVVAIMYPDGNTEAEGRFFVFDGATGELERDFALPAPDAHDAIIFVDTDGEGPDEILLKNRYSQVWMLDTNGELLWTHTGITGHYPWPYDFDGDGREEIMVGYDMLSPDGDLLWRADLADHADTIWVADIDSNGVADVLLGGATISAHHWDTGELIWINEDVVESQNIIVGEFRPDIPGLETFGLDRIDRSSNGLDGLFMLDARGEMVWQEDRQSRGCWGSIPEPIHNWTGDGTDMIMVWNRGCGEPTGIYSGEGEFVTELDDVRLWHGDFCGDTKEEVVEYQQGSWLRILANGDCDLDAKITGEPREQAKREYNFTRYTAGETPVVPVFTAQPTSPERTRAGTVVTFDAEAVAAESYQWQRLEQGEWVDIDGATGASYEVRAVPPLEGSVLRVVAIGRSGATSAVSDEVTLTVWPTTGRPTTGRD